MRFDAPILGMGDRGEIGSPAPGARSSLATRPPCPTIQYCCATIGCIEARERRSDLARLRRPSTKKEPLTTEIEGVQWRPFCHADDLTKGLLRSMSSRAKGPQAYQPQQYEQGHEWRTGRIRAHAR